ncbi:hypothetical protein DFH29DRAFT_123786 [Suillus ampliporus]|nr:hypothetical protein DFH29DRAFT_123786 [Suillus ampliporus]
MLSLEYYAAEAQRMEMEENMLGFKKAIANIAIHCVALYSYVYWSAGVVKTLLTETTLASKFNLQSDAEGCQDGGDQDPFDLDDFDDLEPEPRGSDRNRAVRHLKSILAWHAALESLSSSKYSKITGGELALGFLVIPDASFDIVNSDGVCEAYSRSL